MATAPEIKRSNKRETYRYIYKNKECSKQEIVFSLGQSLPTVNQNISALLSEGVIRTAGFYESTGGRKAAVLQCVEDAKVAVGVEILYEHIVVVMLNLYGEAIAINKLDLKYSDSEEYLEKVCAFISQFIELSNYSDDKILGISVATQGISDLKHKKLVYSRILHNKELSAESFERYIGRECILMHDSETAAFAESFHRPNLRDSSYIFLNHNLGSASIISGNLYRGNHGRGQLIEHMKLVKDGEQCYCGQHGCTECYCSAHALGRLSGYSTDKFFELLRDGDERAQIIWDIYLSYLAQTLHNVLMVMDVDIIIGGLLRKYMTDEDLITLKELIRLQTDFDISDRTISFEYITDYPAARGAALYFIRNFLDEYEK